MSKIAMRILVVSRGLIGIFDLAEMKNGETPDEAIQRYEKMIPAIDGLYYDVRIVRRVQMYDIYAISGVSPLLRFVRITADVDPEATKTLAEKLRLDTPRGPGDVVAIRAGTDITTVKEWLKWNGTEWKEEAVVDKNAELLAEEARRVWVSRIYWRRLRPWII